ncbi:hypothetical protein [Novosphingobium terrae]|uniref:hypothetical protein n=1 Tax=Novosphingobium terrae TaxID=2726189 RepID=UPI0019803D01|nr:hypothetical protein [Novosphingobium terrae]
MNLRSILMALLISLTAPAHLNAKTNSIGQNSGREKAVDSQKHAEALAEIEAILTGPVTEFGLATGPYASSEDNLCRRDIIQLRYSAYKDVKGRKKQKPAGLEPIVSQYYLLDHTAAARSSDLQYACANLSGKNLSWSVGESDLNASLALNILRETVGDVRNDSQYEIDCGELDRSYSKEKCAEILLSDALEIRSFSKGENVNQEEWWFYTEKDMITIGREFSKSIGAHPFYRIRIESAPMVLIG